MPWSSILSVPCLRWSLKLSSHKALGVIFSYTRAYAQLRGELEIETYSLGSWKLDAGVGLERLTLEDSLVQNYCKESAGGYC